MEIATCSRITKVRGLKLFFIQSSTKSFCEVTMCFHFLTVFSWIGQIALEAKECDPCLEQEKEI